MTPSTTPPLRYLRAARRARVFRLTATGALILLPVACSTNDAEVFSDVTAEATTIPSQPDTTTTEAAADTTETTTPATVESTTTTTEAPAEPVDTGSTALAPDSTELVVDFTYAASSQGRVHNPYVAVWVEDADGTLVQTIAVWYEQSGKGTRWLNELRSWYSASGGEALTSGATRAAGSYSLVWDGTGLDGEPVPAGEYVLFIEAAREHGPYSITSTPITVDGSSFQVSLGDDGELTGATATMTA